MIAKIKSTKSINRAIYYNEHKVKEGVAKCLDARNFLKDAEQLSLLEKKEWFARFIALNKRIKTNTLHIPISFAPGENIPADKLIDIAREYMDRIGFGEQPYLVYQHFDTAVPHLHIVTTSIKSDGNSVDFNFIGRDRSEPARKALEEKYGLVKAEKQQKVVEFNLKPLPVERLQYGKRPTRQAITNALEYILTKYKYRSLPELNAILKLYNLKAEPGKPGSRIHQHHGLMYQMLNEKGEGIGIPLKASSIYFKPGLKWLQNKFRGNRQIDPTVLQRIRLAVDGVLAKQPTSWTAFTQALRREQIEPVPYINPQKFLYGLSFVDLDAKLVIKASELGKGYSSKAILQRLTLDNYLRPIPQQTSLFPKQMPGATLEQGESQNEALNILFRSEEQAERLPYELSQKANKKKKDQSRKL